MLPFALVAAKLAIDTAGAIVEHQAQNKQARANEAAANAAARADRAALAGRAIEERIAAAQSLQASGAQAMSAAALARLSALRAGVAGQSVTAVSQTIQADLGATRDSITQNLDLALLQVERQGASVEALRQSRIAAVPRANTLLTALKIGRAALEAGSQASSMQAPKG